MKQTSEVLVRSRFGQGRVAACSRQRGFGGLACSAPTCSVTSRRVQNTGESQARTFIGMPSSLQMSTVCAKVQLDREGKTSCK
eukprot:3574998-Amphidinium_carterae.1